MKEEIKIKAVADISGATTQLKNLTSQVKNVSSQMKSGATSSKSFNSSINTLTKGLRSYISAYAGIQVAKGAINSLRELESNFINIQKTTGLAGAEFDALKVGLEELPND